MAKPASNPASDQFINIQKLHVAKLLTDTAGGTATCEEPIDLGKVLRSVDINPSTGTADLYADGQSIDSASNTASYELIFDTAALPLEAIYRLSNGKPYKANDGKVSIPRDFTNLWTAQAEVIDDV